MRTARPVKAVGAAVAHKISHRLRSLFYFFSFSAGFLHAGAAEGQKERALSGRAEDGQRQAFLTDFHLRRLRKDVLFEASSLFHLVGMATAMVSHGTKAWVPWQ